MWRRELESSPPVWTWGDGAWVPLSRNRGWIKKMDRRHPSPVHFEPAGPIEFRIGADKQGGACGRRAVLGASRRPWRDPGILPGRRRRARPGGGGKGTVATAGGCNPGLRRVPGLEGAPGRGLAFPGGGASCFGWLGASRLATRGGSLQIQLKAGPVRRHAVRDDAGCAAQTLAP